MIYEFQIQTHNLCFQLYKIQVKFMCRNTSMGGYSKLTVGNQN